jgi:hypothetical protein
MPILLISQVHGSWSESDGYVAIPSGTTLHLFQEPGNTMIASQADWGAVASAQKLEDLDEIMKLFAAYSQQEIDADLKKQDYWIQNVAFNEEGFEEQMQKYVDKLKRSVANLKTQAALPLIEDDIIYDYQISSLDKSDQVFDADKPGDPSVTRIRSEILGRVSDRDIMFAEDAEKHLSDYLKDHQGWDIYWFACQYGAATQPDKETRDMLDESKVKLISDSGALKGKKDAPSGGAKVDPDTDWTPEGAYADIRKLNGENVKNTANKGKLSIVAGGKVVLIGEGHSWDAVRYVGRQPDVETGDLIVKKAGAFGKGSFDVNGISTQQQALVTAEIGEFSEKGVTFA